MAGRNQETEEDRERETRLKGERKDREFREECIWREYLFPPGTNET